MESQRGAPAARPLRPIKSGAGAVIDASWTNRHRAGVIQRPAEGNWGFFQLRRYIPIAGHLDRERRGQ
jgi:hypothetical protein